MTRGLYQWRIYRTARSLMGYPCNPGACIRTGQWDATVCVCGRNLTILDVFGRDQ
jgi:hypothetical protein